MRTQKIPNNQKQFVQSNQGDYNGNIWATFNIDLDSEPGVIKTSRRLDRVLTNTTVSTDRVQALVIHDGEYFVVTDDRVASCLINQDPTTEANWATITTLGTEDLGSETDAVSFEGKLLISLGTDIMSWIPSTTTKDNDWWVTATSGAALTAAYPHTMSVLRSGKDTLFVTDKNKVRYYNSTAGHTAITLDTLMTANTLTPSLDRMWAGTFTEVEDNAYVYELRVGDDSAYQAYEVDGRACLTMFTYKNTPFVITEKGYIQAFNGAGFETVAEFPWANKSKVMESVRPGSVQTSPTALAIHPKGAKVSGKYAFIYVNANDEYNDGYLLDDKGFSGVWVLNLETMSLNHRYSFTLESTDYGIAKVDRSGPVLITNTPETRIMVGGGTGLLKGVWMEGDSTPQGWFTTVRHESDSVADAFEKAITKYDTLDSGESVVTKYKDKEMPGLPLKINDATWADAYNLTTTSDCSALIADSDGNYNYDIFILAGHQAGKFGKVTNVSQGTTTKITVSEALGTLNETSDIQVENYKELTPEELKEYSKQGDSDVSTFRQHRVVMTGNVTVREFISKSNSKHEL